MNVEIVEIAREATAVLAVSVTTIALMSLLTKYYLRYVYGIKDRKKRGKSNE